MGRLLLLLSCDWEVVVVELGEGCCQVEGESRRGGVEGTIPLPSGSTLVGMQTIIQEVITQDNHVLLA